MNGKLSPRLAGPAGAWVGFGLVVILGVIAWALTKWVYGQQFGSIPGKALEFPLWAVLVGLVGGLLLNWSGLRSQVKAGFRMELFLKVGLVLLGAGINLKQLAPTAGGALLQGMIMITSVFFFSWWLSGVFGLDQKLRAVMSTALAVCGVSAAIAAAGSVLAKKEQVTYVTALVILVALPLMVLTPLLASAMNLPDAVAGAWFGGNIDTTAAVVGAATLYGEEAQKIASIVKNTQNAMIGLVAFLLAAYFAANDPQAKSSGKRPSLSLIWERFPKFVLGFVLASILYSLALIDGGKGTVIDAMKNWAFTFAFVAMGLEFSLRELRSMGWKPVAVFLLVTLFNTILGLAVAWLIFGVLFV